jgi:hypothetical protein
VVLLTFNTFCFVFPENLIQGQLPKSFSPILLYLACRTGFRRLVRLCRSPLPFGRKEIPERRRIIPFGMIEILYGSKVILFGMSMVPKVRNIIPYGTIVILYGMNIIPLGISMIPCCRKLILFGISMIPLCWKHIP